MNYKVKELFNSLYSKEEKEQKSNPKRKSARPGRRLGYMSYKHFEISPINDFTHFINCEVSPAICPMQWEDLEIDFSSQDKRHCQYCDKYVYKVDNEFMIHKMQDENKCMAVSNDLLEKINSKISQDQYLNLQNRLSLSRLFLVYKDNFQDKFQEFINNDFTQELILKAIILDILNSNNIRETIEWYAENSIDLEIILHQVLKNINDEEFKISVELKLDKLIKASWGLD